MRRLRSSVAVWAMFALVGLSQIAGAQPVAEDVKKAAQARLDRAIQLFNEGNHGASLAEHLRLYQLYPTPNVRYNIGLLLAIMNRSVEAVDWLEACLAEPGSLSQKKRDRAAETLQEQKKRVGTLSVTTNVRDAMIEVDGLEAGKTPLAKPIRVVSGIHVIAVVATGYAPMRREVKVAGLTETPVAFELVPLQGTFARLTMSTDLPGADVLVDGAAAGKTPMPGSLKLSPGAHRIELRRAGYVSVLRDVTLGDGDAQTIKEEPKEDTDWIAANGGSLVLTLSETPAKVWVDGVSRGFYQGSLRLAPGVHRIRAERAGFATVERDVDVTGGGTTTVVVRFEPNPDTLVKYLEDIDARRKWGIATTAGGAAIAGAGAAVLGYYVGQHGKDCSDPIRNPRIGRCNGDDLGMGLGAVGVGLGAAVLGTGIWLIAGNPDPHRYDVKPSGQTLARAQVAPVVGAGAGGWMVGVTGTF